MPAIRAQLGYVGSVVFGLSGGNIIVRATGADIRPSQDVTAPDVVDGRIDRTLYQLGPRILGGTIQLPLVHEGVTNRKCGNTQNLGKTFWQTASQRDQFGRLVNIFDIHIRYTDNTAFTYPQCVMNTFGISLEQSGPVEINMDIIGGANATDDVRLPKQIGDDIDFLAPARIVTWNDFVLKIYGDTFTDSLGKSSAQFEVSSDQLRHFDVTLNNNVERYYTLNNKLAPQDVAAKKRTIEGNIKIMGRNTQLSEFAFTNQDRFTSTASIGFGYTLGSSGVPLFVTALHGVVFEIEEISITNDLVETNIKYTAFADCEANFEATQIGRAGALKRPSGANYGGPTSVGFPGFSVGTL